MHCRSVGLHLPTCQGHADGVLVDTLLSSRQQKPTKINNSGWGGIGSDTTNINKNQQRSTESAKVSKSQQKSAKVSKSQQKSAKVSKIIAGRRGSQQKSALFAPFCKQGGALLRANSAIGT